MSSVRLRMGVSGISHQGLRTLLILIHDVARVLVVRGANVVRRAVEIAILHYLALVHHIFLDYVAFVSIVATIASLVLLSLSFGGWRRPQELWTALADDHIFLATVGVIAILGGASHVLDGSLETWLSRHALWGLVLGGLWSKLSIWIVEFLLRQVHVLHLIGKPMRLPQVRLASLASLFATSGKSYEKEFKLTQAICCFHLKHYSDYCSSFSTIDYFIERFIISLVLTASLCEWCFHNS